MNVPWCLKQEYIIAICKVRSITVNESLREILKYASNQITLSGRFNIENYLCANKYVNKLLKNTLKTYGIKTQNALTHTLRKTFGKRVWEMEKATKRLPARGSSWDLTSYPLIMSVLQEFPWIYTDLYLFVPVYFVTE